MTVNTHATKIVTFGCRLNTYESEVMRRNAFNAGLTNTVIINTCAVTAEAERQARQAIRRARREQPGSRIVVTGCAAQISPETFGDMTEVDQVLGNLDKLDPTCFKDPHYDRIKVNEIMSIRETAAHMVSGFEGRTRAFVQIQNGCDHRCTFCVIPFGRGNSRSVPAQEVLAEARQLIASGYREIVLTGVDITSYGHDLPKRPLLGQLVRRLLADEPDLARLRLSSLDPAAIDEELWSAIRDEPRLMPHLHLSIQAGDDLILKRMKRRHNRATVIDCCARARTLRPEISFGADLIAGFPTETEAMFDRTLELVQECNLSFLHVFPYSPRGRTPAARMPMVPNNVRRSRAARLREAGTQMLTNLLRSHTGNEADVLVEQQDTGRTEHYISVRLSNPEPPGTLCRVRFVGIENQKLLGVQL